MSGAIMFAIGVDVLSIARMEEILSRTGDRFLDRVFTSDEKRAGQAHPRPAVYFATRFAVKEAVFKLLQADWSSGGSFQDIEVRRGDHGEPVVHLAGWMLERIDADASIQVSLSWDGDTACAVALRT